MFIPIPGVSGIGSSSIARSVRTSSSPERVDQIGCRVKVVMISINKASLYRHDFLLLFPLSSSMSSS